MHHENILQGMNKIEPSKIPANVVLQKERTQAIGEAKRDAAAMQAAANTLAGLPDFEMPNTVNVEDWRQALATADRRKDAAYKAIEADARLTSNEKTESRKEWAAWHRSITTACNTIVRALAEYTGMFAFDPSSHTFTPSPDLFNAIDEKISRPVPQACKDHALLICRVADALAALREWESKNNVRKLRLEELLSLDEEKLAEAWADGSIFYPAPSDGWEARCIAGRKLAESQYV